MHEISLVRNIIESLEEEFPGGIETISVVHLKAGLLSNVQPILMQNALAAVAATDPRITGLKLEVEILPILIHCDDCNKTTEIRQYRFICECGKPSRNLVQGDELLISQVVFRD